MSNGRKKNIWLRYDNVVPQLEPQCRGISCRFTSVTGLPVINNSIRFGWFMSSRFTETFRIIFSCVKCAVRCRLRSTQLISLQFNQKVRCRFVTVQWNSVYDMNPFGQGYALKVWPLRISSIVWENIYILMHFVLSSTKCSVWYH